MIFPIRIVNTCSPQLFCHSSCNKQFLVFGIFSGQVGRHAFDWTCSICSYHLMFSIHRLNKVDLGRRRGKETCKLPIFKPCVLKFKSTDFLQISAKLLATFSKLNLCDVLRGSNWKRDNIKQGEGGAYYSFKSKPHTWIKASNVFCDCQPENYSVNRQLLFSRSHMSHCIYLSNTFSYF